LNNSKHFIALNNFLFYSMHWPHTS